MIIVKSNNEELMTLLMKNPESNNGYYLSNSKTGVIVGKCMDKHTYMGMYIDNNESSWLICKPLLSFQQSSLTL